MTAPILYQWPAPTHFGRIIPKAKIYEHAAASTALKEVFVREVEQIVWEHKLAESTLRLSATEEIAEIQVFRIAIRTATLDHDVLRAIDQAVPQPILFELVYEDMVSTIAAYKTRSAKDGRHRVATKHYFQSEWYSTATPRSPLPSALDLHRLYSSLVSSLIEAQRTRILTEFGEGKDLAMHATRPRELAYISAEARLTSYVELEGQLRDIQRAKGRLAREKQFNKRVAINAELQSLRRKLELTLQDAIDSTSSTD